MDEVSAALILKALDGLSQRYLFTAQNIANANSPDYSPVRVTFEDSLRAAAANGVEAIEDVELRTHLDVPVDAAMRLDLELAAASQTSMRYRALVALLGREMALDRAVITGGR